MKALLFVAAIIHVLTLLFVFMASKCKMNHAILALNANLVVVQTENVLIQCNVMKDVKLIEIAKVQVDVVVKVIVLIKLFVMVIKQYMTTVIAQVNA